LLLGVDVGGTFTDAVLVVDGRPVTAKAPSTPEDQSRGVLAAVEAALEKAGRAAEEVTQFAHGMTVATNALLERKGARTVLVATEGFTDVVELGRQRRKDLYRLCARHPAPLVPPERRVGAPERTGPEGVIRELRDAGAVAREVLDHEPEAVAVCLLHADRFPEHERAIGAALAEAGDVHVSLSHDVVGTFREFERAATTEVDAALSPLLARYLRELVRRGEAAGLPHPSIMQSSGGLADAELAARHAALTVLSGPAGGAAAAALIAERTGVPDLLCFDMGGTSCDVCVVEDGRVRETAGREVGGRPLTLPMVDIHTVGAGGGSIGWIDPGGALRVGPRSAGADPGPACYGRGGTEPTVTDANLVLGLLDRETPLAGGVALDADAAAEALGRLGFDDVEEAARGIVRVANAEMVRALRVMTVERGVDPRGFALLAFGGAGGLHAADIADELGIDRIVCPRAGGVLSALGLAAADRRVDVQRTVLGREYDVGELVEEARARIGGGDAESEVVYDCRFRGQSFELTVGDPSDFPRAHEERYGFVEEDGEVEVVTVRATARVAGPRVELAASGGEPERARRSTVLGEETEVLRGELPPGTRVEGPAVCALPEATLAVPRGWSGEVDDHGTVVLHRSG
jgi:N-methylhydantoinase A